MRIPILYQDADIVVIDKPAGIPTHVIEPGDPYAGDAMRIVQAQLGLAYLGMHQRLDAETSGVLLFAARREANRALAAAFSGRAATKVYLALVHGRPARAEGVIDGAIVRERGERYRIAAPGDPRGQPASTRYRVLAGLEMRNPTSPLWETSPVEFAPGADPAGRFQYSLLEVVPETGRSHQIRLHLAHIGVPVLGDSLYGHEELAPRLGLHAYRLSIPHPATGEALTFVAPPPPLFAALLAQRHPGTKNASPSSTPAGQVIDAHALLAGLACAGTRRQPGNAPRGGAAAKGRFAAVGAIRALLQLATSRRAPLAADPATTIYRLVNGAADGLPGLAVDRYGPALVASVYADFPPGDEWPSPEGHPAAGSPGSRLEASGPTPAGAPPAAARWLPPDLQAALAEVTSNEYARLQDAAAIYVKFRPQQASRVPEALLHALAPSEPVAGQALGECTALEEGLTYLVRPGDGWNAGLFPDMRELRGRVRAWAAGRRVLNCFAYTCGFGVAAAAGGASRVLNLDLSRATLERGQANYRANGLAPDPHDFVYGDVFDWLGRLARRRELFDLVILDPPGFSKTKTRRFSAEHDYGELARLAGGVVGAGGLLVSCCNVAGWPWQAFRENVLAGLAQAQRAAAVAGIFHAPAIDFPVPPGGAGHLKILVTRLT